MIKTFVKFSSRKSRQIERNTNSNITGIALFGISLYYFAHTSAHTYCCVVAGAGAGNCPYVAI